MSEKDTFKALSTPSFWEMYDRVSKIPTTPNYIKDMTTVLHDHGWTKVRFKKESDAHHDEIMARIRKKMVALF